MQEGKKELVSIVVPVYSVENYLRKCLDSLIGQTYHNIEIILVDDGSKDRSGEICDEYGKRDNRIRVMHKENGGVSSARNEGMKMITGEYVTFVDADDFLDPFCIEYLMGLIREYQSPVGACGYRKVSGEFDQREPEELEEREVRECLDKEDALEKLLYQKGVITTVWAKIFERRLLEGIEFPIGKYSGDVPISYQLFSKADKVAFGSKSHYFYVHRQGSMVNSGFHRQRMDGYYFTKECVEFMEKNYPSLTQAAITKHYDVSFELLGLANKKKYPKEYELLKEAIRKYGKAVAADKKVRPRVRLGAGISCLNIDLGLGIYRLMTKSGFYG